MAGRLEFIRGWKLDSDNSDFGGISSMLALPDNRFVMLSDSGVLIGFTLMEQDGKAVRPYIAPLPDGPAPANRFARQNWDAESMVHDPETGQYWVGYEHSHSIWRYGPAFARKEADHKVAMMQKWPSNGGAEAMLRLAGRGQGGDRFLIFSESAHYGKARGVYQALIFDGDPAAEGMEPKLFGYRPPKGYLITDAALLPDGRALLLHRRFTPLEGVSAIVSIGDLSQIEPGEIWSGEPIASLKPPMTLDNMEALAVTREGDDTIIWIASDDNFNVVQQSLLMKFRLLPDEADRSASKAPKAKAEACPGFSSIPD
ncbi:esterase-like activity of phytase family protein [Parasphingorhabdus sp.]|uniref:esterase-like activity of phytase family protein n=1 Tax=Parasphingorhabdus sp. TaxID=2709688 RepID=UPI002F937810